MAQPMTSAFVAALVGKLDVNERHVLLTAGSLVWSGKDPIWMASPTEVDTANRLVIDGVFEPVGVAAGVGYRLTALGEQAAVFLIGFAHGRAS